MLWKTRYQNAEIIITEWNSSFIARDIAHDTVRSYSKQFNVFGLVDGLVIGPYRYFWRTPTDNKAFLWGFGLINIQVQKAGLLRLLVFVKTWHRKDYQRWLLFCCTKDDSIQVLIWNYCHYNEAFAFQLIRQNLISSVSTTC